MKMNGHVILDTPIAVDFWRAPESNSARIYFLSHFHADHMCQLKSTWRYPIYTSTTTGKLLVAFKNISKDIVRPLETGSSHIIPLDDVGNETMTVTLIDANHCPGAVMFLFQGYFGNILYTGDFRYDDPAMLGHPAFLDGRLRIDRLYVDNTYCSPVCAVFPPRREVTRQVVDLISKNRDIDVFIGMRNLGKEDLLVDIALALRSWIVVSPDAYRKLQILGYPEVFTTEEDASLIRAIPFHEITPLRCRRYLGGNREAPALFVLPTCVFSNDTGFYDNDWPPGAEVRGLEYSDHSSFDELSQFVSRLRPALIQPIVAERKIPGSRLSSPSNTTAVFDKFLSGQLPISFEIPHSVRLYMDKTIGRPTAKTLDLRRKRKFPTESANNVLRNRSATKGVVFCEISPEKSTKSKKIQPAPPDECGDCKDVHQEFMSGVTTVVTISDIETANKEHPRAIVGKEIDSPVTGVAPKPSIRPLTTDEYPRSSKDTMRNTNTQIQVTEKIIPVSKQNALTASVETKMHAVPAASLINIKPALEIIFERTNTRKHSIQSRARLNNVIGLWKKQPEVIPNIGQLTQSTQCEQTCCTDHSSPEQRLDRPTSPKSRTIITMIRTPSSDGQNKDCQFENTVKPGTPSKEQAGLPPHPCKQPRIESCNISNERLKMACNISQEKSLSPKCTKEISRVANKMSPKSTKIKSEQYPWHNKFGNVMKSPTRYTYASLSYAAENLSRKQSAGTKAKKIKLQQPLPPIEKRYQRCSAEDKKYITALREEWNKYV